MPLSSSKFTPWHSLADLLCDLSLPLLVELVGQCLRRGEQLHKCRAAGSVAGKVRGRVWGMDGYGRSSLPTSRHGYMSTPFALAANAHGKHLERRLCAKFVLYAVGQAATAMVRTFLRSLALSEAVPMAFMRAASSEASASCSDLSKQLFRYRGSRASSTCRTGQNGRVLGAAMGVCTVSICVQVCVCVCVCVCVRARARA